MLFWPWDFQHLQVRRVFFTRDYIEQNKVFNVILAMGLSTSPGKKGRSLPGITLNSLMDKLS